MTRRELIQYLYEQSLKEGLEIAPLKRLALEDKMRKLLTLLIVDATRRCVCSSFHIRLVVKPFLLLSSSFALEPPSCRISTTQQLPHLIFPSYMKSDGFAIGFISVGNLFTQNWEPRLSI